MPSPTTPLTYQIVEALRARFATATAGATYWHTLSGDGQCVIGEPSVITPPRAGSGMVYVRFDTHQRDFGDIMTVMSETLNVAGWMVVPYLADTTAARTLAISKGHQDITTALETDMTLGGLVMDSCIVNVRDLAGDESQMPARFAAFSFEVRCKYYRARGSGT